MPQVLEYEKQRGIPRSLQIVGWIFIGFGILSVIDVLIALFQKRVFINLGVLEIFCGFGLLRLSRGWRSFALVVLWIEMISMVVCACIGLVAGGSLPLMMNGTVIRNVPARLAVVPEAGLFLLALWQYRILIRRDVIALFRHKV